MNDHEANAEEIDQNEGEQLLKLPKINGVHIRKRIDPTQSNERELYQIIRSKRHTIKGTRITFQILQDSEVLYTTKFKGKRPNAPIPIQSGSEMHYRDNEFAGYLHSGNNHCSYSLRIKNLYGKELISIQFNLHNGQKSIPKQIVVSFFIKDSLIPQKLVNMPPTLNDDGGYELPFYNKMCIPSIKNCVMINEVDQCHFMSVRKIDKNMIEVDAVEMISPLSIFGFVLSIFQCPY